VYHRASMTASRVNGRPFDSRGNLWRVRSFGPVPGLASTVGVEATIGAGVPRR
jgi:hypothetical protein